MSILSTILLQLATNGSVAEVFFRASTDTIDTSVSKCLVLMPLALFMHLMIQLTKAYFGNMQIDITPLLKVILIWICLAGYTEIIYAIYDTTFYLGGIFGNQADILTSLNKLADNSYLKQHSTSLAFSNIRLPFDDFSSFLTYILLAVENGLSMLIRLFIERIRAILLAYVLAAGPIAFTISAIPGFGGTLLHWLKIFISTSLWSLTLAILDAIMNAAIPHIAVPTGSTLTEAAGVIDILILNGAVILMYLSVPLLTSYYIGGNATGSFLRAAQGAMGAGMAMAGNFAIKNYNDYKSKSKKQEEDKTEEERKRNVSQSNQVPGNE